MASKHIYRISGSVCDYSEDPKSKEAKALLGGKGAGLVMMAKAGCNVPPAFTITTEVCNAYRELKPSKQQVLLVDLMLEVMDHMKWLTEQFGYTPLVSVRSGAPVSMPGMMDTILNVGMTEGNFDNWEKRLGNRAAIDSWRRLIQMLGSTGYGIDMAKFDDQLAATKKLYKVESDTDLTSDMLDNVLQRYRKVFKEAMGFEFPDNDAEVQLHVAIKAVFDSWMNPRAIEYRKINHIDEGMGTAVTVQAMVFGNMGDDCGTGVLFSREPSTGQKFMMGEFLTNAQGEDVVAGIRTPMSVERMHPSLVLEDIPHQDMWHDIYTTLLHLCAHLEDAYMDMVDIEFTVQKGELFVLQSRSGKRSARAAFQIATDLVSEGKITKDAALGRLTREQFKVVRRPTIDPSFKGKPDDIGLPACPGVVSGIPVFTSEAAVNCKEPCILVRHETDPDDIAGMAKAVGILTQTGGATSHAAVVARAMDKACVVGCTTLDIPDIKEQVKKLTIDGSTGRVWFDIDVPVIDSSDEESVKKVTAWCMAKQGAIEASPVGLGEEQHLVFAAHWWGSEIAAEAILADMPKTALLDDRHPRAFASASDFVVQHCFGEVESAGFFPVLKKLAKEHKVKFAPVLGNACPGEYAVFQTLTS